MKMIIKFEDKIKREVKVGDMVILVNDLQEVFVVKILDFSVNKKMIYIEYASEEHKNLKGQKIWRFVHTLHFVDFIEIKKI